MAKQISIVRQYKHCHCQECPIHSNTCHSRCKDYLRWKAEEDTVKAEERKRNECSFSERAKERMIENIRSKRK